MHFSQLETPVEPDDGAEGERWQHAPWSGGNLLAGCWRSSLPVGGPVAASDQGAPLCCSLPSLDRQLKTCINRGKRKKIKKKNGIHKLDLKGCSSDTYVHINDG